jgi:hypothetical protein
MKFFLTRDSALWWMTILGSVVAYLLADGRPPTVWVYGDWLKAIAFSVSTFAGKMGTSPLRGEHDGIFR